MVSTNPTQLEVTTGDSEASMNLSMGVTMIQDMATTDLKTDKKIEQHSKWMREEKEVALQNGTTCGNYGLPECDFIAWYAVPVFIISISIVLANVINIFVLSSSRAIQPGVKCVMINLTVADLCLGILCTTFSLPLSILGHWPPSKTLSSIAGYIMTVMCNASVAQLVLLSMDRYLCISFPLRYSILMSPWRRSLAITLGWFIPMVSNSLPIFGLGEYKYQPGLYFTHLDYAHEFVLVIIKSCVQFPIAAVMLIYFYIKIWRIRSRHIKDINSASTHHTLPMTVTTVNPQFNMKGVRMYLIAIIAVMICWCPFYIEQIVNVAINRPVTINTISFIFMWLGISNSFVNFPIYYLTFKPYREQLKKLLKKISKKS